MLELWLLSLISGAYLKFILITLILASCVIAASHAVIYKREPRAALGWFIFIISAPIIGVISYRILGLNRIQKKGLKLDSLQGNSEEKENFFKESSEHHGLGSIFRSGERLCYSPVCAIDLIEPLDTGDQAYPKMIEAIESAEQSVTLYSYIFELDSVGQKFVNALVAAHKRGVSVRVLVDGVGSKSTLNPLERSFEKAGVPFAIFLPTWLKLRFANLRNHRKILVIDNTIAFTGGLNIAQTYWPSLAKKPVLDFHFYLKGEIVNYIQAVFMDDWFFCTEEDLSDELWPASFEEKNNKETKQHGRVIKGGPGKNTEKIQWHFVSAINNAKDSIKIITPYFLPSKSVSSALIAASIRGIKVEIIIPEKADSSVVTWAMHASLYELLAYECDIRTSLAPFDHSKILIVDDNYSSIGSANWDIRSFRLNFEMNVEIYSLELAKSLTREFNKKKDRAENYSLEQHEGRSYLVKLRGGFARMLTPYL